MSAKSTPFPCTACGLCCKKVGQSQHTQWLDRGDGVCRHYDDQTRLCSIYSTRPQVCRVEEYYQAHLSEIITWQDFVQINLNICRQFQAEEQQSLENSKPTNAD